MHFSSHVHDPQQLDGFVKHVRSPWHIRVCLLTACWKNDTSLTVTAEDLSVVCQNSNCLVVEIRKSIMIGLKSSFIFSVPLLDWINKGLI